jgi:hypothetical protein
MRMGDLGLDDEDEKEEDSNEATKLDITVLPTAVDPNVNGHHEEKEWQIVTIQESDEGKSATDEGKSATDEGKWATDEGKWATDEGKWATDEGKLATDEGKLATDEDVYEELLLKLDDLLANLDLDA